MDKITLRAYAKLNLSLDVLGTLPNGYHDLEMIMQSVDLYDEVILEKSDDISVFCDGVEGDNIAVFAAREFFTKTDINGGVKITINKHIPLAAGLAGGSADAAAVLVGLNQLYGANLTQNELCEIGVSLGADIPFCIIGGTAKACGVGEVLTPLAPMPDSFIVLIKEGKKSSTGQMYARLDDIPDMQHPNTEGIIEALNDGDLKALAVLCQNVFSPLYEDKGALFDDLLKGGAIGASLSGSGPTVFGIFDKENKAKEYVKSYKGDGEIFLTTPINFGIKTE